jgi:hypothetical protein
LTRFYANLTPDKLCPVVMGLLTEMNLLVSPVSYGSGFLPPQESTYVLKVGFDDGSSNAVKGLVEMEVFSYTEEHEDEENPDIKHVTKASGSFVLMSQNWVSICILHMRCYITYP